MTLINLERLPHELERIGKSEAEHLAYHERNHVELGGTFLCQPCNRSREES